MRLLQLFLAAALLSLMANVALAQAPTPPPSNDDELMSIAVTDDDVNRVARRIYCPVCEAEPLHTCMALTCFEWRAEIRSQLEAGRTDSEIISYFVEQSGQQVVGIPQDDGLRALAFAGPIIAVIVAIVIGILTLRNWQTPPTPTPSSPENETHRDDDAYRSKLEDDLRRS